MSSGLTNARAAFGSCLSSPLPSAFVDGAAFVTEDGGLLRIGSGKCDPDDEPVVYAHHLATVSPIPEREAGDDVNVFSLTTTLVDAEGTLWERSRAVSIFEIWSALLDVGEFESLPEPSRPGFAFQNAIRVQRRVLLDPIQTCCDSRERRIVEVLSPELRNKPNSRAVEQLGIRRLLFRLRLKYFGAEIALIEDRMTYPTPAGAESHLVNLGFTINPLTDAEAIACLDASDAVIHTDKISLLTLGPLCVRGVAIKSGWESPHGSLPRCGDLQLWRRAFEPHMDPATLERSLKSNLKLRHERR